MQSFKKHIGIILVLLFALVLRINMSTFLVGCDFDEFAMISVANSSFPIEFFKNIAIFDYHAPLYYILAHFVFKLKFPYLALRLVNVLISVFNVFIFYKIGKLLVNRETGIFLALFLAINKLNIIITNYIKFYVFAFLIFSLVIYYFVYFLKNKDKEIRLAISNLLLSLVYTYGFIFVFIELCWLYFNKKTLLSNKFFIISILGFILYFPILCIQSFYAFSNILSPHGSFSGFSIFSIFIHFNDYLTQLVNYPSDTSCLKTIPILVDFFRKLIFNNSFDINSILIVVFFSIVPILIAIYCIFIANKNKYVNYTNIIVVIYFLISSILSILEISAFIPIYNFVFGLTIVINTAIGLSLIKQNKIKYIILVYFLFVNLFPLTSTSIEDIKQTRMLGIIDRHIKEVNSNTPIIIIDAGRFSKLYFKDKNIYDFDFEEIKGSHGRKYIDLIYGKNISSKANKYNIKEIFEKEIFLKNVNPAFEEYIKNTLIDKLEKNQEVKFLFYPQNDSYIYTDNEIKNLLNENYLPHFTDSSLSYLVKNDYEKQQDQSSFGSIIGSYNIKLFFTIIDKYLKINEIEKIEFIDNRFIVKKYNKYNKDTISLLQTPLSGYIIVTYQKL